MQWEKRKGYYIKHKYKIIYNKDYNTDTWTVKYDPENLEPAKPKSVIKGGGKCHIHLTDKK